MRDSFLGVVVVVGSPSLCLLPLSFTLLLLCTLFSLVVSAFFLSSFFFFFFFIAVCTRARYGMEWHGMALHGAVIIREGSHAMQ